MKRGQAALEFLMTYGWAILVVLVVIGALAYFGVLNPSILLPEKCTLETGMNCRDFRISSKDKAVYLKLENGKGKGIILTNVTVNGEIISDACSIGNRKFSNASTQPGCGPTDCTGCPPAPDAWYWCNNDTSWNSSQTVYNNKVGVHISNGEAKTLKVGGAVPGAPANCSIEQYSGKTKGKVTMKWYFDDSTPEFAHTMEGELLAKVEN